MSNPIIDLDGAIVRYVGINQPCPFGELAELFVEAPAHTAAVPHSAVQALQQRLTKLCNVGRLARMQAPRLKRRDTDRRRARYIVPAGVPTQPPAPQR